MRWADAAKTCYKLVRIPVKFPKSLTYRSTVPELPESPIFCFQFCSVVVRFAPLWELCAIYHFYKETGDRACEDQAVGLPPADLSCKVLLELHGIILWPSSFGVAGDEGGQNKYSTQAKYFPFWRVQKLRLSSVVAVCLLCRSARRAQQKQFPS